MLFNSTVFICFHILALLLYWSFKSQRLRLIVLLIGSLVFYGWYYWPGLILLTVTIFVNYGLSWAVSKYKERWVFIMAIIINLCNLGWFKYATFVSDNLEIFLGYFINDIQMPEINYWLPLGISFYTFQFLGYLIDIKRGEVEFEKSILHFAVFKSLYAQLIAGPIVRAKELMPQLHKKQSFSLQNFQKGFFLVIGGLFIKICTADVLAQYVDYAFDNPNEISTLHSWISMYGFAFQILGDFWGYSTIAVGVGLMYGILLPSNFNFPYRAASFQDFWRRWHITLSVWFRDYLYIPLGGSRTKGLIYRNLILTMTIAGVWHGAGWNFVIWGFGHGLLLAIERKMNLNSNQLKGFKLWSKRFFVFNMICLLWVFFRAEDFQQAMQFFESLMLPPFSTKISNQETLVIIVLLFALLSFKLGRLFIEDNFLKLSLTKQLSVTVVMILLMLGYAEAKLDFIYFVF